MGAIEGIGGVSCGEALNQLEVSNPTENLTKLWLPHDRYTFMQNSACNFMVSMG